MFSKPHVEATVLSSGNPREVAVDVMPAKVEAQLDIRLLPSQDPKQVVAEINKLLDDLKKADPKLEVRFEVAGVQKVSDEYWSRITDKDPLVQEILKLSRDYTGKDVKMSWRGGVGGGRPDLEPRRARGVLRRTRPSARRRRSSLTGSSTRTSPLWYLALA